MRVLVACEFSGVVRDAFRAKGHDAWSCDLLPSDSPGPFHIQDDVRHVVTRPQWADMDLLIAHPPCTLLARAGARWWKGREAEQTDALAFVRWLLDLPVPRIAVENPPGKIGTAIRPADQYIQPWEHGHEISKTTGLWLKGLPPLRPSKVVGKGDVHVTKSGKRLPSWYSMTPGPDRWKNRSRTLPGIAAAMADQWGHLP
jgi:site-specific DNA-cytosine methylase